MVSPLRIQRIDVGDVAIEALVRLSAEVPLTMADVPGSADRALGLLPGLVRHSCENGRGRRFVDELADTETAHLLEHVTVELMSMAGSPRSLKALTSWDFSADGPRHYRLRIEFDDDLVAIGALKAAVVVVEWLLDGEGPEPDVDTVVSGLFALRDSNEARPRPR